MFPWVYLLILRRECTGNIRAKRGICKIWLIGDTCWHWNLTRLAASSQFKKSNHLTTDGALWRYLFFENFPHLSPTRMPGNTSSDMLWTLMGILRWPGGGGARVNRSLWGGKGLLIVKSTGVCSYYNPKGYGGKFLHFPQPILCPNTFFITQHQTPATSRWWFNLMCNILKRVSGRLVNR